MVSQKEGRAVRHMEQASVAGASAPTQVASTQCVGIPIIKPENCKRGYGKPNDCLTHSANRLNQPLRIPVLPSLQEYHSSLLNTDLVLTLKDVIGALEHILKSKQG